MATRATGPRTEAGKEKSSRNATRHGLTAAQLIISGENPAEFDDLLQYLVDAHQPAEGLETILVNQIAQSLWRLNRARRLEQETLEQELTAPEGAASKRLEKITRYMTAIEREFHRNVRELTAMQNNRTRNAVSQQKKAARQDAADFEKSIRDYIYNDGPAPNLEITKRTPASPTSKPATDSYPENWPLTTDH